MTFGEKLSRLRKENNYTQEQLAEILEVSRQSVSKWESDLAYPETEKLIRIGKLFDCSMDYLLKESCNNRNGGETLSAAALADGVKGAVRVLFRERKSQRTLWGMPLYHIGRNARGFFAVGLRARGVVSVGMLSTGVLSLGLLSIGLFAFGTLALGLLSVGTIALGLLAAGAISIGVVAFGALSVGCFSAGALAIGQYLAIGDYARAMIAIGDSEAVGSLYQHIGNISATDMTQAKALLDAHVPVWLTWAKEIMKFYLV